MESMGQRTRKLIAEKGRVPHQTQTLHTRPAVPVERETSEVQLNEETAQKLTVRLQRDAPFQRNLFNLS